MYNIYFLILHYKSLIDTQKCIKSILALHGDFTKEIFLIDNGSNDNSLDVLQELYAGNKLITILSLKTNLGFSAGNNFGYKHIIDYNIPDFLVVTNSDIVFRQNDFGNLLISIYVNNRFDILGPDIYAYKFGIHQSPISTQMPSESDIKTEISNAKMRKDRLEQQQKRTDSILEKSLQVIRNSLFIRFYNNRKLKTKVNYRIPHKQACLNGACLIFSKDYMQRFDSLFYPETFLYYEEQLLYLKAIKHNMEINYDPNLKVYHAIEASTTYNFRSYLQKKLFQCYHLINSGNILLKELQKYNISNQHKAED